MAGQTLLLDAYCQLKIAYLLKIKISESSGVKECPVFSVCAFLLFTFYF